MTTGSRKPAGSPPGSDSGADAASSRAPGAPGPSDAYVEKLGDRLSSPQWLPEANPGGFAGPPSFVPMHETSDVHTLPAPGGEDDEEALEFPPVGAGEQADAFAEFEDEIEGEATRIDDGHLLAEQSTAILSEVPVQPFLFVERGSDKGREFVLQEGENGIGRGIDNDVILADVAVSRRHLIIVREGDILRLRDLGSGNGTQLNGKRTSTAVLNDGDRIEVGETVLVVRTPDGTPVPVLDPDAATDENHIGSSLPPAAFATPSAALDVPQSPGYHPELTPAATSTEHLGRRKGAVVLPKPIFAAILLGGSLLLAMLGAAVAVLIVRSGGDDEETQQVTLAADEGPFSRGVCAYEAQRWDEAERSFRQALEASGSDPRVNEYLQRTQRAREHASLVASARTSLASGDANTALTQASSVPADSPLFAQAQQVRAQATTRQVSEHLAAARAAWARSDAAEARRRLALARNLEPGNAEVTALAAQIDAAPAPPQEAVVAPPPTPTVAVEAEDEDEEEEAPSRGSSRGERAPRRARSGAVSTSDVISAYLAGRFDQAAQLARAAAARSSGSNRRELEQLASSVERFGGLYRRIQAARFGPSVRHEMEQAIALDRRIARSGQYRDRLRSSVVDAYLGEARRNRSNPVQSCSSVRQALAVDGGNVQARQMSGQCEATARGMIREASSAPPERATSIYRNVLLMVPSGSAVARDASSRLEGLRRRRAVDEDE